MKTLVIAEPGCTAQGSFDVMMRLLHVAAECGASCFKPQWTSSPERMCERRKAPDYLPFYRWLAWPVEWHARFRDECHARGLKYACSVYLPEDVAPVASFVDYLKISSFEATDKALCDAARESEKEVIVSHGMESRGAHDYQRWWPQVHNLHCVSAYPAPIEETNLRLIFDSFEVGQLVGDYEGLSDHSRDLDMGAYAVCAGAQIIETHYRLYDCDPANPDYSVAFDPGEFAMYVSRIRRAERIMGDGVKQVQPSEAAMLQFKVTA